MSLAETIAPDAPILKPDVPAAESDEDKPGVILDPAGDLVSVEILDALQRFGGARRLEFEMVSNDRARCAALAWL